MSAPMTGDVAAKVLAAIDRIADDVLDPAYPEAMVDEDLRAMGVDPDELDKRTAAFIGEASADLSPAQVGDEGREGGGTWDR